MMHWSFVGKLILLHSIYIVWVVAIPVFDNYLCCVAVIIYGMVFARCYNDNQAVNLSRSDMLAFANRRANQTLQLLLISATIYLLTYAVDHASGIPFMGVCILPTKVISGGILAIMCPLLLGIGLAIKDR